MTTTDDRPIAVGIARQSHGDGESIDAQIKRLEAACERDGMRLLKVIREQDVSGGTPLHKRKGLLEAVELVEAGKASVIVGAYFDRLVRSLKVQAEMVERVEAKGGRVLALDTGEVTNGSAGQWLSGTMLGAVSEYHRRATGERVRDAQAKAIAAGVPCWSGATAGYFRVDNGPLVPHPEHAAVVAEAFRRRADEEATITELRGHLREHGIPLSFNGVQTLLKSRVVLGELHFGKLENLEAHPAIVERDVWQRVQGRTVSRGRHAKSQCLLARLGVLRCSSCGARMVVGNSAQHKVYRCPATSNCGWRMAIMAHMADDAVKAKVKEVLVNAEGRASIDGQARKAKADADAAQARLTRATRIALAGDSDDPEVEARLEEFKAAAAALRARAQELESLAGIEIVTVADLERASLAKWRRLIRSTIRSAKVWPGRGAGRISFETFEQ